MLVAVDAEMANFLEQQRDGFGRVRIVVAVRDVELELDRLGGKEIVAARRETDFHWGLRRPFPIGMSVSLNEPGAMISTRSPGQKAGR